MATRTIEVRTTDAGLAWLQKASTNQGVSVSEVIRRAVSAFPHAEPKYKTDAPRSNRVPVRLEEELVESLSRERAGVSDVVAGCLRDYQFATEPAGDEGVSYSRRQ